MFTFALLDTTGTVTPKELDAMREACERVSMQFTTEWGIAPIQGRILADACDAGQSDIVFSLELEDPAAPDALGYHDEQDGIPFAHIMLNPIRQNGGTALGDQGIASVVSHELWETVVDEYVNDWVMMPSGILLAKETADPVESLSVLCTLEDGTVVSISDAVLPRYFDAQAPTDGSVRFSLARTVTKPFDLTPGGYQIQFDPSKVSAPEGPISNVWGSAFPAWKKAAKLASRTRLYARMQTKASDIVAKR